MSQTNEKGKRALVFVLNSNSRFSVAKGDFEFPVLHLHLANTQSKTRLTTPVICGTDTEAMDLYVRQPHLPAKPHPQSSFYYFQAHDTPQVLFLQDFHTLFLDSAHTPLSRHATFYLPVPVTDSPSGSQSVRKAALISLHIGASW